MKPIKLLVLIISALFINVCVFAQGADGDYPDCAQVNWDQKDASLLSGRTLLVVVDDEQSEYGKTMKNAFTQHWRATPVQFIKSSEIEGYTNSDKYAIFCFALTESCMAGVGRKMIKADEIPNGGGDPKTISNAHQRCDDFFDFLFYVTGKYNRPMEKHNFDNLRVCDFAELNIKTVLSKPINYYQALLVPYIVPYVKRFNYEITAKFHGTYKENFQNRKMPETFRGKKEYNIDYSFWDINNGAQSLSGKKIYIDSSLVNYKAIRYFAHALNTDTANIVPTSRDKIAEAFENNATDILELDYCKVTPGTSNHRCNIFTVYDTQGQPLVKLMCDMSKFVKGSDWDIK